MTSVAGGPHRCCIQRDHLPFEAPAESKISSLLGPRARAKAWDDPRQHIYRSLCKGNFPPVVHLHQKSTNAFLMFNVYYITDRHERRPFRRRLAPTNLDGMGSGG